MAITGVPRSLLAHYRGTLVSLITGVRRSRSVQEYLALYRGTLLTGGRLAGVVGAWGQEAARGARRLRLSTRAARFAQR